MLRPYANSDLSFAWSYVTYLRWKTYRGHANPHLQRLDQSTLDAIALTHEIRILESTVSSTELVLMASLRPTDSVSTCVSKLKGQTSKWLRDAMGLKSPTHLWSRSYFACSIGGNTREAVEAYLAKQSQHHGYAGRQYPPVSMQDYPPAEADELRLQPKHGKALIQLHICLSTVSRTGVFNSKMGENLTGFWNGLEGDERFALRKVAILPDHVHLALRVHPAAVPSTLVVKLMNLAQGFLFQNHREEILATKLPQIWHPGAYVGTYGDLTMPKVRDYLRAWEEKPDEP